MADRPENLEEWYARVLAGLERCEAGLRRCEELSATFMANLTKLERKLDRINEGVDRLLRHLGINTREED